MNNFTHPNPSPQHACTYAHAHMHAHACTHAYVHVHAHTYMHTSIHTHTCTHTHAYACMHMHTCMRLGKRAMPDGNPLASALGEDPFIPLLPERASQKKLSPFIPESTRKSNSRPPSWRTHSITMRVGPGGGRAQKAHQYIYMDSTPGLGDICSGGCASQLTVPPAVGPTQSP